MPDKVFFQCSLPRTGSTLLQNILNQNPRFYASANNGLIDAITAARESLINGIEYRAQDPELLKNAMARMSKAAIEGYYDSITGHTCVVDKSMGHFGNYELISNCYPNPKIICMVRNMEDIVASMERLYQKNQSRDNDQINQLKNTIKGERNMMWASQFWSEVEKFNANVEHATKMHFIRYEDFCRDPKTEMHKIYAYFDLPLYIHNFTNVKQTVKENEMAYGYIGMLEVRPAVEPNTKDANDSIDPLAKQWIEKNFEWYNEYFGYKTTNTCQQ